MRFTFLDHTLDLARRELRRSGAPVWVEPKVFDLLAYLLRHADRVVSRDELIDQVWRGRVVSDAALDTALKAARQAVGDSGALQRAIRTVPRKGLRFVADLAVADDPAPTPPPRPAPLALPDKPSIAVLPFLNLGDDPGLAYLADGMADDLINALSSFRWMFVIARNTAFRYQGQAVDAIQVGRDLGVRHVLEGSIRTSDNRVRLGVQLIDASTGASVWARRFDRQRQAAFALQDELTAAIAGALAPALERSECERARRVGPAAFSAWDHWLRGVWHFHRYTRDDAHRAIDCFGQAQAIDPAHADAWAWTARAHLFFVAEPGPEGTTAPLQLATTAGRRALTLDRDNALAHYALALCAVYAGDFAAAGQHAARAVDLNPNLALGHAACALVALRTGRHEAGLAALDNAARLSPNDSQGFIWESNRAVALYRLGRYEAAADSARRSASMRWYARNAMVLAASLAKLGQADEARAVVQDLAASQADGLAGQAMLAQFTRSQDHQQLLDDLRAAGLPL